MGHTGENEQALRKIIDFTRMGSIIILAHLTLPPACITDRCKG